MRMILIDGDTELVRCNFRLEEPEDGEAGVERLSKAAAGLLDTEEMRLDRYELGSFAPTKTSMAISCSLQRTSQAPYHARRGFSDVLLHRLREACNNSV
jgi:hypothetical protein